MNANDFNVGDVFIDVMGQKLEIFDIQTSFGSITYEVHYYFSDDKYDYDEEFYHLDELINAYKTRKWHPIRSKLLKFDNHNEMMIDIALATNDEKWFMELTKNKGGIRH